MTERIASRENKRIKHAVKLSVSAAFRKEECLFFAEGYRLCVDLAQSQKPLAAFFTEKLLQTHPELEVLAEENFIVSEPVADKLSITKNSQGIYCLFRLPKAHTNLRMPNGLLVCENIQDPANIGAIVRSSAAFGLGGVLLLGTCADPFSVRALRSSAGAVLRLPIHIENNLQTLEKLKEDGVNIYAAALNDVAVPLPALEAKIPFALLVGNEGAGLSPKALAISTSQIYIPMSNGVESLNAAVAASLLMFHFKTNAT